MKEKETPGLPFKLRNPTTSRTSLLNERNRLSSLENDIEPLMLKNFSNCIQHVSFIFKFGLCTSQSSK